MTGREIRHRILAAAAEGLNELADKVAADSLLEVPLEVGELRASGLYPGNDTQHAATAGSLEATVSYNTVYAAAQHEGVMEYERGGNLIVWVVRHHTEPGTKTKYLEDPFKAMIPRMEPYLAAKIKKALV